MTPPPETVVTYTAYSAAVLAALRARFDQTDPPFRFGEYELADELSGEPTEEIATPALLLEVDGWDGEETGFPDTFGRRARRLRVNIHCLLGFGTPALQAALRELSLDVDAVLFPADTIATRRRGATWGLGGAVDPVERPSGAKGGFSPGLHGVDAWVVSFEQVVYLA